MPIKLCRWGNSLGLRIPAYIADVAHLKVGDQLTVRLLDSGQIAVTPFKPRQGGSNVIAETEQPTMIPVKKNVW